MMAEGRYISSGISASSFASRFTATTSLPPQVRAGVRGRTQPEHAVPAQPPRRRHRRQIRTSVLIQRAHQHDPEFRSTGSKVPQRYACLTMPVLPRPNTPILATSQEGAAPELPKTYVSSPRKSQLLHSTSNKPKNR